VYRYFGDEIALETVIDEVSTFDKGGTIAVFLGRHALARGYRARIYTYDLVVFDPTWFEKGVDLARRLRRQRAAKDEWKLRLATDGYLEFLKRGGEIRFEDLNSALIRRYLGSGIPILTGLSSTYLYHSAREFGPDDDPDDVRGSSAGHFVVLAGYDREKRSVLVADPYLDNPVGAGQFYTVPIDRVVCAILLGVLTYDANLLVIEPKAGTRRRRVTHERPRRRQ
jgi:hypothetical protein